MTVMFIPKQLRVVGTVSRGGSQPLEGKNSISILNSSTNINVKYLRYDLKMYLPVYMWTLDCRKRGVNLFLKLLNLISMCDGEKIADLKIIEVKI